MLVGGGSGVLVGGGSGVSVEVGMGVLVGNGVRESVDVRVGKGVRVRLGVSVNVPVGIRVAEAVRVGVRVGGTFEFGLFVGEGLNNNVDVNVTVTVLVCVVVRETVDVAKDVSVGDDCGTVAKAFGVLVGVKKRSAKASTVSTRSVLVAVGVPSPVFGMMRSGSTSLGLVMREIIKGRLKARLHAPNTANRINAPLLCFAFNPMLLSVHLVTLACFCYESFSLIDQALILYRLG